jgi:hypothetical protein
MEESQCAGKKWECADRNKQLSVFGRVEEEVDGGEDEGDIMRNRDENRKFICNFAKKIICKHYLKIIS